MKPAIFLSKRIDLNCDQSTQRNTVSLNPLWIRISY